jgi:hypothetical protein
LFYAAVPNDGDCSEPKLVRDSGVAIEKRTAKQREVQQTLGPHIFANSGYVGFFMATMMSQHFDI